MENIIGSGKELEESISVKSKWISLGSNICKHCCKCCAQLLDWDCIMLELKLSDKHAPVFWLFCNAQCMARWLLSMLGRYDSPSMLYHAGWDGYLEALAAHRGD